MSTQEGIPLGCTDSVKASSNSQSQSMVGAESLSFESDCPAKKRAKVEVHSPDRGDEDSPLLSSPTALLEEEEEGEEEGERADSKAVHEEAVEEAVPWHGERKGKEGSSAEGSTEETVDTDEEELLSVDDYDHAATHKESGGAHKKYKENSAPVVAEEESSAEQGGVSARNGAPADAALVPTKMGPLRVSISRSRISKAASSSSLEEVEEEEPAPVEDTSTTTPRVPSPPVAPSSSSSSSSKSSKSKKKSLSGT